MRARLRTILIFINVVVLFLPLAGIGALRIYDSELIRQTESSLIAQGAFVQSIYRESLVEAFGKPIDTYGRPFTKEGQLEVDGMTPVYPEIELAEAKIYPPAPPAERAQSLGEPTSIIAGKKIVGLLKNAQKITLSGIRVVNMQGVVVSSTRGEMGESLLHREEVSGALAGKTMRVLRQRISDSPDPSLDSISRRTKVRVFIGLPIVEKNRIVGAVVLSRTPLSLQKALYQNRFLFIGFFVLIIIVALSISILTAVTIQRPMTRLLNQMRAVAKGEKVNPLTKPRTKEVDELSNALVEMANKIEHRSTYISNFARTVSHEFKTPIASIRGSVELLTDHIDSMSSEEQTEFLILIDNESQRIQNLLTGLLVLAKADMGQVNMTSVSLSEACPLILANFPASDSVDIVESYLDVPNVSLPDEVLGSVLRNLIENAIQADASALNVNLFSRHGKVVLQIQDNGKGIPEADLKNVFVPFFTTKRSSGGSGLGLAIIASMLTSAGASIEILKSTSDGTTFDIVFDPRTDS